MDYSYLSIGQFAHEFEHLQQDWIKPFVDRHLKESDWNTLCNPGVIERSRAFADFERMVVARFGFLAKMTRSERSYALAYAVWDRVKSVKRGTARPQHRRLSTTPTSSPASGQPYSQGSITVRTESLLREGYVCYRCRLKGHHIRNCPTNNDPEFDGKLLKTPLHTRSLQVTRTLQAAAALTETNNIPENEPSECLQRVKIEDDMQQVDRFLDTSSSGPDAPSSDLFSTSMVDVRHIKNENGNGAEDINAETNSIITISDDEDAVIVKQEKFEATQQLPPGTDLVDAERHIRISRRLGGDQPTLCFQTHLSVLAANSHDVMASLQFRKLVLLAKTHMGFDSKTEVLTVEHGPADSRMHMFVKDDESLKSTVEVLLPALRVAKILEVLVLNRPSFMGYTS